MYGCFRSKKVKRMKKWWGNYFISSSKILLEIIIHYEVHDLVNLIVRNDTHTSGSQTGYRHRQNITQGTHVCR